MAYTHCLMAGMCTGATKKPYSTSSSESEQWAKISPARARCPSSGSSSIGNSNFCERKWMEAIS